ncbi:hypothetical protein SAMN05518672_102800 [Chitinophaga sp. CF118]|uniref:hypothetical protein n=1 Tax=Chitinophaga sp. CF118 TaxID=1884367 RepID=UPI0008EA4391|nr:hypothetical protein [Chitinophaga sp. CF118]SFD65212.1 hypothetical protein SAMN05518672_102800 [Chitinophaga sp. CF118]
MLTTIEKIEQYIDCYGDCEEPQKILDELHDTAMSSPDADIWTSDKRSDVILFYRQTKQLLDAIFSIAPSLIAVSK